MWSIKLRNSETTLVKRNQTRWVKQDSWVQLPSRNLEIRRGELLIPILVPMLTTYKITLANAWDMSIDKWQVILSFQRSRYMSVLFEHHEHIPFSCTDAHANKRTTQITMTFRFCSLCIPSDPGLIPSTYRGKLSLNNKGIRVGSR